MGADTLIQYPYSNVKTNPYTPDDSKADHTLSSAKIGFHTLPLCGLGMENTVPFVLQAREGLDHSSLLGSFNRLLSFLPELTTVGTPSLE